MKPLPFWLRMFVRVAGTVAPGAIAGLAYRMFWHLGTPLPVRERAREIHERARVEPVRLGTRQGLVYSWGDGDELVLLVHGWRGRGAQFADLVHSLESSSRTVVAFDAPGNGSAPGDRTDIFDYLALIRHVVEKYGQPSLMIAHSFGALAAFTAVRQGVRPERLVSIAGVGSFDYVVDAFVGALALPRRAAAGLRRRIENGLFGGKSLRGFVSELDPTDTGIPLLVIHDRGDRAVDFGQSTLIAEAHTGSVTELHTEGLGHTRILSDPTVLAAIEAFSGVATPRRSGQ